MCYLKDTLVIQDTPNFVTAHAFMEHIPHTLQYIIRILVARLQSVAIFEEISGAEKL